METKQKVKLTKSALSNFLQWTSTKYNDWLDFGTKKEAVERAYNNLANLNDGTITLECASSVGENGRGRSWRTSQGGERYIVDCKEKKITALNSKREIYFI